MVGGGAFFPIPHVVRSRVRVFAKDSRGGVRGASRERNEDILRRALPGSWKRRKKVGGAAGEKAREGAVLTNAAGVQKSSGRPPSGLPLAALRVSVSGGGSLGYARDRSETLEHRVGFGGQGGPPRENAIEFERTRARVQGLHS